MNRTAIVGALAALAALSCGASLSRIGPVFDTSWQDDSGKSIGRVHEHLAEFTFPKGANVAVGVVDDGVVGVPLEGGARWKFTHALDARPMIAGQVVVGTGGGSLFALEASTGRKLWERQSGGQLRGAGDDGYTTVVSLAPSGRRGGVLLAVARDGGVVRQLDVDVPAGLPAVAGNLAFIPWQNQYVTVYNLTSGDEVARVTFRRQTSRALWVDGRLYFGEFGLTRFDDKIAGASRNQANFVELPARELPGTPRWMRPGGQVLPPASDALDRIRLHARPANGGETLTIDSDRYYATYYHAVMGFRARQGELAWVRMIPQDAIGGAAYAGGVAVCDDKGEVQFFDAAAGAAAGKVSLGTPVQSCVVQADSFSRASPKAKAEPLVQQISEAIQTRETEMVMIQRFLIRELTDQPDEEATRKLIELATDPRTSPVLMQEVREGLSARRNGVRFMTEALAKKYDFLSDVLTMPPVGPLAFALGAMGETSQAPVLVDYLLEPQLGADDLKHVALALALLAGPEQLEGLLTFATMYRCSTSDDDVVQAVAAVARTLLRIDKDGMARVRGWVDDPLTSSAVREVLASLTDTGKGSAR
jgi:outer membrane protein assembly factor BamB